MKYNYIYLILLLPFIGCEKEKLTSCLEILFRYIRLKISLIV